MPDQTLAQRIRAKYPDAYTDLSDADLEAAVKAKYPGVYDDLPMTQATAAPGSWGASRAKAAQGMTDLAIGAAKGLGESVVGAGQLIYNTVPPVRLMSDAVNWAVDRATGGAGPVPSAGTTFAGARQDMQPTNTAQAIGKGAEQVGEFFLLPTGKGKVAVQAAEQAVGSGLLSNIQGGGTSGTVAGAVMGAAGPGVAKGVEAVGGKVAQAAKKGVQQALGGQKEYFKAMGERIAPEFLQRRVAGWTGMSQASLLEKATAEAGKAGQAVDAALAGHGADRIATQPVIEALESAKQGFVSPDTGVPLDSRVIGQLDKLKKVVTDLGADASVSDLVAVRRVWDDIVARVGGFEHRAPGGIGMPLKEQTEAWAKREGANAIRRVLAEEVPDLAAVNKEFRFWKSLEDVLTQTAKRETPQKPGLGKTILTAAGMSAGAMSGDSPMDKAEKILIYGTIANRMAAAFRSPQWKLISANLKHELANAIASGQVGKITSVLHRVTVATGARAASQ